MTKKEIKPTWNSFESHLFNEGLTENAEISLRLCLMLFPEA